MPRAVKGQRFGGRAKGVPNKNTVVEGGVNLIELARVHTQKALDILVKLLDHDDDELKFKAAQALLDRGYGKPAQAVMLQGDENKPIEHNVKITFVGA